MEMAQGRPSSRTAAGDRGTRSDRRRPRRAGADRCRGESRRPLRRTLDHLFPDHVEPACRFAEGTNATANPKVRKAALIAMDQLDSSPLRREQIAPLLRNSRQGTPFRRALGRRPVTPTGPMSSSTYLSERLHDPATPLRRELDSVRDALVAFSANAPPRSLIAKASRRSQPR